MALSALMAASYAQATINADRSLHSFKLSLDQFMVKRGAAAIVARGRGMKQKNAALFASIEQRYGVPAGPADCDLGHGERLRQPARQPEHALLDRDAGL